MLLSCKKLVKSLHPSFDADRFRLDLVLQRNDVEKNQGDHRNRGIFTHVHQSIGSRNPCNRTLSYFSNILDSETGSDENPRSGNTATSRPEGFNIAVRGDVMGSGQCLA